MQQTEGESPCASILDFAYWTAPDPVTEPLPEEVSEEEIVDPVPVSVDPLPVRRSDEVAPDPLLTEELEEDEEDSEAVTVDPSSMTVTT